MIFFDAKRFNFARQREKKNLVFFSSFLVFLCFLGGVFVLFGVCFVFRALARKKSLFRRWNEQNREFSLCPK